LVGLRIQFPRQWFFRSSAIPSFLLCFYAFLRFASLLPPNEPILLFLSIFPSPLYSALCPLNPSLFPCPHLLFDSSRFPMSQPQSPLVKEFVNRNPPSRDFDLRCSFFPPLRPPQSRNLCGPLARLKVPFLCVVKSKILGPFYHFCSPIFFSIGVSVWSWRNNLLIWWRTSSPAPITFPFPFRLYVVGFSFPCPGFF